MKSSILPPRNTISPTVQQHVGTKTQRSPLLYWPGQTRTQKRRTSRTSHHLRQCVKPPSLSRMSKLVLETTQEEDGGICAAIGPIIPAKAAG
jgi:hypothetical protein